MIRENKTQPEARLSQANRWRLTDTGVELIDTPGTADNDPTPAPTGAATEDDAPFELPDAETFIEAVKSARRARRRKWKILGVTVILLAAAGAAYFWLGRASSDAPAYRVAPPAPAKVASDPTTRGLTAEEITQELQKHAPPARAAVNAAPNDTAAAVSVLNQTSGPESSPPDYSATVTPAAPPSTPRNNTFSEAPTSQTARPVTAGRATADQSAQSAPARETLAGATTTRATPTPTPSPYQAAHSVRVQPPRSIATPPATALDRPNAVAPPVVGPTPAPDSANLSATSLPTPAVSLPPLGTLLPVRTLAQIYTVRAASWVRLQLTREVSGPGWTLPPGTEFYGQLRGAESATARAWVSVQGYIDPATRQWVALSGQLLGADGAEGLPGRTHKLNAGWRNALKKAGSTALATVATLAGNGRRPIVITDGGAQRVLDPLAEEAQSLAAGRDGDSFVAVPAATAGYILVITDPHQVRP